MRWTVRFIVDDLADWSITFLKVFKMEGKVFISM